MIQRGSRKRPCGGFDIELEVGTNMSQRPSDVRCGTSRARQARPIGEISYATLHIHAGEDLTMKPWPPSAQSVDTDFIAEQPNLPE